eukprot:4983022-Pyramimonas_sp.AAC.1
MTPDVASFLPGPDARERGQLQAMVRLVKAEMHWAMGQGWIQKAKAEPQKQCKAPTHWGPCECLHC